MSLPRALQVLTDLPLAIDPDEVLRFQGYKKGRDVASPDVRALLDDALAEGARLMAPRAVACWVPVARAGAHALIPRIGALWGPVTDAAVVVCTIGDALERRVSELWEARELPLASMLDSVGSGAVESLAEHVNDVLCQQGLPDLRVTNRISPGSVTPKARRILLTPLLWT